MTLRSHFPDLKHSLPINGFLQIKAYIPGGMFPSTTSTCLMFILMLGIVFLTLKLARPEKVFKTSQKHTKFKHSRGDSLRGLTLHFYVLFN